MTATSTQPDKQTPYRGTLRLNPDILPVQKEAQHAAHEQCGTVHDRTDLVSVEDLDQYTYLNYLEELV